MTIKNTFEKMDTELLDSGDRFARVSTPEKIYTITGTLYPGEVDNAVTVETDQGDIYLDYDKDAEVLIEVHKENQPETEKVKMNIEVIQKRSAHMTVEIDPVEFKEKTGMDLDHAGSGDIWEFLHQVNPSYSKNLMWFIDEEDPHVLG